MTRILIVDDNTQNTYLLQVLLSGVGYVSDSATNGAEALEIARREPPDLVISDILMPVMDGFALCRAWKQDERLSKIPFIFYTATYTDSKDEAFALSLGAERFAIKPMPPEQLLAMVRSTLDSGVISTPGAPQDSPEEEPDFYRGYNAALVRKLESKTLQLEKANQILKQDIAERKKAEARLRASNRMYAMLSGVNQTIVRIREPQALFDQICRIAIKIGEFAVAWIGLLDDSSELRVAARFEAPGVSIDEAGLANLAALCPEGLVQQAIRSGERSILDVVLPDTPCMEWAYRLGVRSLAVFPLLVLGRVRGAVCLLSDKPYYFDTMETDLLNELILDVAFAMEFADNEEQGRRTGLALQSERSLLRTLVDNLPDSIYAKDPNGRRILANAVYIRSIGATSEAEVLGKTDFDLFPRDRAAEWSADDQAVVQSGQPMMNRVERFTCPGGDEGWQLVSKVPLRDSNGRVVGMMGIGHDTTAQVRAGEERERFLAQIETQARQITQIIDTVPEGMALLDEDGRVLLANAAGSSELAMLGDVKVGERLKHLGGMLLDELLLISAESGEWFEIHADRRVFEVLARPVFAGESDAGGATRRHWVLVISDVTKARDIREQLSQQERLAAVGRLAAGIAHDFNNILAIIALQAPLLARAPGISERDGERLTIISEQTAHATRLVQQLLDFSRRSVLERQPIDLAHWLEEQSGLLARTLPETIRVDCECEPGEYVVEADPTRLQQVLMNLAINARDAMAEGGILRLRLARQVDPPRSDLAAGGWIRLSVADDGTGIAPEVRPHLFEPFFTTKDRGHGTGLGLAQVHGIVKQHGGDITVESVPGKGATFTVFLSAAKGSYVAPTVDVETAPGGGGQTILVVEDNAVLLDAMSDTLETLGYRAVLARNGVEALAILMERGHEIALVLSDLVMPVMGGDALLAAMKTRGLTVPLVMLSGHPLEGELEQLRARGLVGWLLKPPQPDVLAQLLARTLASRSE